MKAVKTFFLILSILLLLAACAFFIVKPYLEAKILKQIIERLESSSRIAEVIVTEVTKDAAGLKELTTIKFVEYNKDQPLAPKYFTFPGNLIQFQSLVVRFGDKFIEDADPLRGKSVYLFWKVFLLDGANTIEYTITPAHLVPEGYKISSSRNYFEDVLWRRFWRYALDEQVKQSAGIKNAQLEAPGTRFIPGVFYTLRIEHDGGIRIDTAPIPLILQGEKIP